MPRPEIRARRRQLELEGLGIRRTEADLLAELTARDAADKSRPISPLKQAPDAFLLDTSDLGIDAAFAAALDLVERQGRSRRSRAAQGLRRPGGAAEFRSDEHPRNPDRRPVAAGSGIRMRII